MNKYLIIFLKSGLLFGLSMGVVYSIQNKDIIAGTIGGIAAGILFGLVISLFSYITDKKLKKEGLVNNGADVYQVREYIISKPSLETLDVFKEALSIFKKYKTVKEEKNSITIKTGFSWKSFGEIIVLSYKPINDTETQINISSRPSIKLTLVDYGINFQNVEKIEKYFKIKYGGRLQKNT